MVTVRKRTEGLPTCDWLSMIVIGREGLDSFLDDY